MTWRSVKKSLVSYWTLCKKEAKKEKSPEMLLDLPTMPLTTDKCYNVKIPWKRRASSTLPQWGKTQTTRVAISCLMLNALSAKRYLVDSCLTIHETEKELCERLTWRAVWEALPALLPLHEQSTKINELRCNVPSSSNTASTHHRRATAP